MPTCFVIMPIGDQQIDGKVVTATQLKARYDDLIKEALLKARSDLEVVRADEVTSPSGITTDIFTRLMHSDFVVADVSYPNPNVFYELGIRHTCRPGAIVIRDKDGASPPFDISVLRHVEYENSPTGLKVLAARLSERFAWFEKHPGEPDNDFLALAKLTGYTFQRYGKPKEESDAAFLEVMVQFLGDPELLDLFLSSSRGEPIPQEEMVRRLAKKPEILRTLMIAMLKSGQLSL